MSDEQDFFFDEEPEARAKDAKETPEAKAVQPKAAPRAAVEDAGDGFFSQDVTMGIASLMAVVALLVGIIVGILLPNPGATGAAGTGAPIAAPSGSTGQAPPLPPGTDTEQLPDGHPDISGAGGSSAASETTTGK